MAIPNNATGGGNNNATEVLRVAFSTALSTAPRIEAWDNSSTFPANDASGSTTAKEIFTGTTVNGNIPMMAGYSGGLSGASTPPGASWHPASVTPGSANPNLLEGTTSYVTAANTPGAGENTVYNLSLKAPSDATVPSTSSMAYIMQVRYTFTGTPPALTFSFNDGGTEGTPIFTTYTPGTHGIRFVNTGTVAPTYKLTLPASGTVDAGELWVTV